MHCTTVTEKHTDKPTAYCIATFVILKLQKKIKVQISDPQGEGGCGGLKKI